MGASHRGKDAPVLKKVFNNSGSPQKDIEETKPENICLHRNARGDSSSTFSGFQLASPGFTIF